jgi:tetratricopeptide (TPR) repeat protein
MTRPALMFALVFLAVPAMAAVPHKQPLPAKEPPVAAALSADDLMRQAQAASAKGDSDLAFRLAQAAIVADPAKPATYDLLADLYAGAGQGDYASFYYSEALGIDPSDAAASRGTAQLDRTGNQRAAEAVTPAK